MCVYIYIYIIVMYLQCKYIVYKKENQKSKSKLIVGRENYINYFPRKLKNEDEEET